MNADNFEELVSRCVLSGFKHRLLYVFIRVHAIEDEEMAKQAGADSETAAGVVQILFDAHQQAEPGLTFDQVRQSADAQDDSWNFIVVGIAKNSDASLPDEAKAVEFLADMRQKIMVGQIDHLAFLDRTGSPVGVQTDVVSDVPVDGAVH
ncbi:MAG TPA: hypothetical protein ENI69_10830 [Rhodospirillales bacterium]|nr:hypothetical protein [Rhodospirillales bacterium]